MNFMIYSCAVIFPRTRLVGKCTKRKSLLVGQMFTLIVKGCILWKSGTQIHKITLNQKPERERERSL